MQKLQQPVWIDTRAFAGQSRRQQVSTFGCLIKWQIHHYGTLSYLKLVTTHTVVLLDYPPTVLNVLLALIGWIVEQGGGHVCTFSTYAPEQKCCQGIAPFGREKGFGHAQAVFRVFLFTFIVDRWLRNLVLEKSLVVVPGTLFLFRVKLQWIHSFLSDLRLQGKIKTFNRGRTLNSEFLTNTLLIFKTLDLVTAGTSVLLDQHATFFFHIRIIHERGVLVARRRRKRE